MRKTLVGILLAAGAVTLGLPALSHANKEAAQNTVLESEEAVASVPTYIKTSPSVAVGDVNNDGKLDMIIAAQSLGGAHIYTLLNNGDGTYTRSEVLATVPIFVKTSPSLEVADLNKDGHLDLIVAARSMNGGQVYVLYGSADGTYSTNFPK